MSEARLEAAEDRGVDVFGFIARFAPTLFLIALMLLFAIIEPRFLSQINLFNVMRQVSITGLLVVGMTFVILTAGIDLSVGSLLAFAGLVAAAVAKGGLENRFTVGEGGVGYGWFAAALAAVAVGLACGWLQGLAITRLKVPPFVVTLGGMSAFRGAALLFAAGGPISGFQPSFTWWGQGKIGPVPVPVIRPAGLCSWRQSGGGAPFRAQRQSHHHERLHHNGLLCRPRLVRARGAAQFCGGRRRHRL
jgi:inositol transport system permease protein